VIPYLTNVTIAPLTRSARPIATHVNVTPRDGVPSASVTNLDNIQTVPKAQVDRKIVRLHGDRMDDVYAAIRAAFEMP
jgi:mRNA interferase MazF